MGQSHDILGLIITVYEYSTLAQPKARRAATLHCTAQRNTGN